MVVPAPNSISGIFASTAGAVAVGVTPALPYLPIILFSKSKDFAAPLRVSSATLATVFTGNPTPADLITPPRDF